MRQYIFNMCVKENFNMTVSYAHHKCHQLKPKSCIEGNTPNIKYGHRTINMPFPNEKELIVVMIRQPFPWYL